MNGKYKVIIVDDDKMLCSVFKEGLLSYGFDCETALNGTSALELIRNQPFDLMVTDIIMPRMDGFELTEQVKKIKPDMAVIVMTGFQQDESYDRAISIGASDFIKKPFGIKELTIRIERVMRDSKIISEIRRKQEEVRAMSHEMITGVQDEALNRIAKLEEDIVTLRKNLS